MPCTPKFPFMMVVLSAAIFTEYWNPIILSACPNTSNFNVFYSNYGLCFVQNEHKNRFAETAKLLHLQRNNGDKQTA